MTNDNVRSILEGDIIVGKVSWDSWALLLKLHKENLWSRSPFTVNTKQSNDMDYWKLETVYQAGKIELLRTGIPWSIKKHEG